MPPDTWTNFLDLSLHKSNSCLVRIDLPHVQVFVFSKTCIKLIWSKPLCQTTLLGFLKSAVTKTTTSEKNTLGALNIYMYTYQPVSSFCRPKFFIQPVCFGVSRSSELYSNRFIKRQIHALANLSQLAIFTINQEHRTTCVCFPCLTLVACCRFETQYWNYSMTKRSFGICCSRVTTDVAQLDGIGLITVFGVILTGKQSGQKRDCLFGIPWQITYYNIEVYAIYESQR